MPKVFIINDSGHDYTEAKKFGELVFLTTGTVASYDANKNYRQIVDKLKQAKQEDFILITSLASLNCIVGWIIGHLNLPLNMLLFKDGKYLKRRLTPRMIKEV